MMFEAQVLFENRGTLRKGWIIHLDAEGVCEVLKVTESRATIRPFRKVRRTITPTFGTPVSFAAPSDIISISPQSEVSVLALSREKFAPETMVQPATT